MAEQRTPESPPYQFDAAAFHKELDLAQNIASDVSDPIKTPAVERTQAGQKILVFRCPKCKMISALSGPGRHKCHPCATMGAHTWLLVEKAG